MSGSSRQPAALLERRQKLLGPAYRLFYDVPLHIVRGEGVWLYDAEGRRYLDMYNNVPHVGHCHPHVVDAICRQVKTLNTHTRYLHDNVLDYAERLLAKLPAAIDRVMFSCTGSEANELALRIARYCSGGRGIVVTDFAYHGNTQAIYEISTEDAGEDERPDHVVTIPSPQVYRKDPQDPAALGALAEDFDKALATLERRGIRPAAFVVDTIMSSDGVVEPPRGFLKLAADKIRAAGGLFVADEVQPGFGRTGRHFWGFEIDDVVPDIVTMGKPMGNGHPLAATATRADLLEAFAEHAQYFNTFGGNPVSAAAGNAVLDVIESESLQENALDSGLYLNAGLNQLAGRFGIIGDVRGEGLFKAVELVDDRQSGAPAAKTTRQLVNRLCDAGVLTGAIGRNDNILKLRPPMVFSRDDADFFLDVLSDTLAGMGTMARPTAVNKEQE